ncbi:hypothetical protein OIU76_025912 [Salix suchowensis]|nr:hypothetical protein OIU76_025912 [Salix suchowensis]
MRLFSCFILKKKSSFKWIIANDFGHVINVADKSKRRNLSQVFTFHELAVATENFNPQCLVGEGGFGKIVAVKQLDRNGLQGNREFFCEVLTLSLVQHSNLVKLIGYCADGNQRLLVYEFMASGSLENHLLGSAAIQGQKSIYSNRRSIAWRKIPKKEFISSSCNCSHVYPRGSW